MSTYDWIAFVGMPVLAVLVSGVGAMVFRRWLRRHAGQ